MSESGLYIVLVGTTHPGNVGASARAMKTMGLSKLRLVSPKGFSTRKEVALSSGALDILESAEYFDDLKSALSDCVLAVGSTARVRSLEMPSEEPRACAARCVNAMSAGNVAIVFGPEHSGLSNEDLDLCQSAVSIPANPDFSSLNLAAAVQVLCYELALALRADPAPPVTAPETADDLPASLDEMEGFYQHLQDSLVTLDFLNPDNPRHLMRRLRRLFNRAQPSRREVNILRGILRAAATRTS